MKRKKFLMWLMILFCLLVFSGKPLFAEEKQEKNEQTENIEILSKHGILMEVSTGEVLFEKDADKPVAPASVTKIMTMLLIFDALEAGNINLEDKVTVSDYAASMGGSQVFLEPGEMQTVETMLKCIAVASANDACVAMAEYISGSVEEFVNSMNRRAEELGMKNSEFKNCNGLDEPGHCISARDVALMSREILTKYPQIHKYCTIWMEDITHQTAKGNTRFGLSNTNKLLRQYEYCTGLKTGSTKDAGFCVSACAKKGELELIAVIMNGETGKIRFADAKQLLEYGFANVRMYRDEDKEREKLMPVRVVSGVKEFVVPKYERDFTYLLKNGEKTEDVKRKLQVKEEVTAPLKKGDVLGTLTYYYGEKELGKVDIIVTENLEAAKYMDYVKKVCLAWMM